MTQQQLEKKADEKPDTVTSVTRRNGRGCKSEEFYNWPEQSYEDMDSPLATQQYIQQLIRKDSANIDEILKLPEGQDLGAWKIEHLRLFCMQLNRLAAKLQECCHPEICNQMTATEQWIFLCAAHKQPNECPAIDYTHHTLDGASSMLNSNKYFPSRVSIKETSVNKIGSVCRRVYRIFSHAYYHHFQVFDEFEKETHLCKRFSKYVTIYGLMAKDCLIVPSDGSKPEAEPVTGGDAANTTAVSSSSSSGDPTTETTTSTTTAQTTTTSNTPSAPTTTTATSVDTAVASTTEVSPSPSTTTPLTEKKQGSDEVPEVESSD